MYNEQHMFLHQIVHRTAPPHCRVDKYINTVVPAEKGKLASLKVSSLLLCPPPERSSLVNELLKKGEKKIINFNNRRMNLAIYKSAC